MLWLFYVTISSFFFALGNIFEKIVINKYVKENNKYGYIILTYFIYGITTVFLFPFADLSTISLITISLIILRALSNLIIYYFWLQLMMKEEISRVVGITFLYILLSFLYDYLLFATQVSYFIYIGGIILITSVIFMTYKPAAKKFIEKKEILYLLAIIILWGFYGILLKTITKTADIVTFLFLETATVLIVSIIIIIISKKIRLEIQSYQKERIFFWLGVISLTLFYIFGLITSFKAYTLQKISLVAPFETLQPTFVFLIALSLSFLFPDLLKEEIDKKTIIYKIIALILLAIGIFLVMQ